MMKLCLVTAAALTLVSASPPGTNSRSGETAASGYPPCSRTVTDRCIQLYERGVKTSANLARNDGAGLGATAAARGGPYEAAPAAAGGDYPPCSATVRDRCNQLKGRGMRAASVAERRIRSAGERG